MFGRLRTRPDALTKSDITTLNQIDLAYMRAYAAKNIDGLRGMLAPACLDKVGWVVHSFNNRYFADDKFRHTEWIVINSKDTILTLKKNVTFDKVHINAAMSINVANNYAEQWVISKKSKLVVLDIENWKGN